jgi:serine/threonine protein kinase
MGVILFVLLSGTTPKTPEKGVTYNQYFASVSADAKNLIEWMLKPNPEERAHLSDIVAHPWLRGVEIVGKELARRRSREECEALQLSHTTVAPVQPSLTASGPSMLNAVAFLQQAAAGKAVGGAGGGGSHSPSNGISKDGGHHSSSGAAPTTPLLPPGFGAPVLGTVPVSTPPTPSTSATMTSAAAAVAGIVDDASAPAPAALVRWYWQSNLDVPDELVASAWTAYSATDSEAIERMYRRKTVRSCKIPSTEEYRVSFEGMFQYRVSDTARQRPVRRWEGTPEAARMLTVPGARIAFSKI